ncbi:helix-turn-helix protein [Clostridium puniceum]|uniref:Helix-turn-helix protein n=1 Tax=Clostridium puniceum TaxID=29367 RepID=A0A1S8TKD5_9CLOT|nr:helix-turn-helix transcriptional regulator [Clostridium puniceum]OOM78136.1 helix-turn-helix protein [Clostridium puniceum]
MNIIAQIRTEKGISQSELGRRCSLSSNHISRIESGKKLPSNEAIKKISRALNICPIKIWAFIYLDDKCNLVDQKSVFCIDCQYFKN